MSCMVVFTFSPHEDPDAVMKAFKNIGNRVKNKWIRFIAVFQQPFISRGPVCSLRAAVCNV